MAEASSSRLFPPNPSLSPQQPSGSILLNASGRNRSASTTSSRGFSPARSISALSINSFKSPSIAFAPLPEVPPELKRRSSITLGIAARSNLLKSQGSAAPNYANGQRVKSDVQTVMMSDEQWEQYKRRHEGQVLSVSKLTNREDPPDLGDLAMKTGKKLWRRARGSFSSTNSSGSSTSPAPVLSNPPPVTPKFSDRKVSESTTLATIDSAPSSPSALKRTFSSPVQDNDHATASQYNALGLMGEQRGRDMGEQSGHEVFNEARKLKETKGEFGLVRAAENDADEDEDDEKEEAEEEEEGR